ncbi:HET-domain-containing protein [Lophium mytilinum]|uniref:HET-domain-containing protein n=1 Tax=Lophium mytilinum TaxID=390894 RepID=A0A6A6QU37_9PEZI|nr:HET-domain-containing protein [Lophium mytilinum]
MFHIRRKTQFPWKAHASLEDQPPPQRCGIRRLLTYRDIRPRHIYRHTPLPHSQAIRLLYLHPGDPKRDIRISLQTHNVSDSSRLDYTAISYAWGDGACNISIECDGSIMLVTENIYQMLFHIQQKDSTRLLWVDAICINQCDAQEKSQQILLMRNIYSEAPRVIVWLGAPDKFRKVATAIATLKEMAHCYRTSAIVLFAENKDKDTNSYSEMMNYSCQSLFYFLGRPWFKRLWTFQEVCLPENPTLLCGAQEIAFNEVFDATCMIFNTSLGDDWFTQNNRSKLAWALYDCTMVRDVRRYEGPQPHRLPLSTLLWWTSVRLVKDPRDRIYSLLGLATGAAIHSLKPDYREPFEETYVKYSKAMIEDDGHLGLLSCTGRLSRNETLPTWVPDWTQELRFLPFVVPGRPYSYHFVNQGAIPQRLTWRTGGVKELCLFGYRIDTIRLIVPLDQLLEEIKRHHPTNGEPRSWKRVMKVITGLVTLASVSSPYWPSDDSAEMAFMRTLCAGCFPDSGVVDETEKLRCYGSHNRWAWEHASSARREEMEHLNLDPEKDWIATAQDIKSLYDNLFEEFCSPSTSGVEEDAGHDLLVGNSSLSSSTSIFSFVIEEICHIIRLYTCNRVLFVTANGYIGLGPLHTRASDEVCTLHGGYVPFSLRRTDVESKFELLGEAYVHGIMQGELWNKSKPAYQGKDKTSYFGDLVAMGQKASVPATAARDGPHSKCSNCRPFVEETLWDPAWSEEGLWDLDLTRTIAQEMFYRIAEKMSLGEHIVQVAIDKPVSIVEGGKKYHCTADIVAEHFSTRRIVTGLILDPKNANEDSWSRDNLSHFQRHHLEAIAQQYHSRSQPGKAPDTYEAVVIVFKSHYFMVIEGTTTPAYLDWLGHAVDFRAKPDPDFSHFSTQGWFNLWGEDGRGNLESLIMRIGMALAGERRNRPSDA